MTNPRKRKARILAALQKAAQSPEVTPTQMDDLVEKARALAKAAEQLTPEQIDEALQITTKEPSKDAEKKQTTTKRKAPAKKTTPAKKRTRKRTAKTKK